MHVQPSRSFLGHPGRFRANRSRRLVCRRRQDDLGTFAESGPDVASEEVDLGSSFHYQIDNGRASRTESHTPWGEKNSGVGRLLACAPAWGASMGSVEYDISTCCITICSPVSKDHSHWQPPFPYE